MCGQKHRFASNDSAFAIYSGVGILLVLISSVAFIYMLTLDSRSASNLVTETVQIQDAYELLGTSSDLEQVVRKNTEDIILNDSMKTYGAGAIEIKDGKMKRGGETIYDGSYNKYKEKLGKQIQERVFTYYHKGNATRLNNEYSSPIINYDFQNFITTKNDFTIELEEDTKNEQKLGAKVNFIDGKGIINSRNVQTGSKLTVKTEADVDAKVRPFTMHDKTRNFVGSLDDSDIKWTLWGVQEVIAMVEANTKHDVTIATDPRITYTLTHLLVAWKEADEFGSIDYIHIPYEALRPWIGSSDGSSKMNELFSTLKEAEKGGYDKKLKKMVTDMEDAKSEFENHVKPASVKLWSARTKFGSSVKRGDKTDRPDMMERIAYYWDKRLAGTPDDFDRTNELNNFLNKVKDDFSNSPEKTVNDRLKNATTWEIKESQIDAIVTSINADSSTVNLENGINSIQEFSSLLSSEHEEKTDHLVQAKSGLNEAAADIASARESLSAFRDYINNNCNDLLAKDLFIDKTNGKTLNDSLVSAIKELSLVEGNLNTVQNDLYGLQNDFATGDINVKFNAVLNSLNTAKSDLEKARTSSGSTKTSHLNNAKNNLNSARSSLVALKNNVQIKNKAAQIGSNLDSNADRIFHTAQKDKIIDPVIEIYLITKGIKEVKDGIGDIGDISSTGDAMGFIMKLMGPLLDSMNKFTSMGNMLKSADISLPNKYDQVLSILPMPPWTVFGNQEFSPVHEIWWQTSSKPFTIDLVLFSIGGTKNSLQIPYTSININLYKTKIQPLDEYKDDGETTTGKKIDSHLRVIDFRNAHIGEVLDFKVEGMGEFSGVYPLPIKYHRYPMYHYRFTAPTIEPLLPVIIIGFAGPFTQDVYKGQDPKVYIPTKKKPADEEELAIIVELENVSETQFKYTVKTSKNSNLNGVKYQISGVKGSIERKDSASIPYTETKYISTDNFNNYGWEVISVDAKKDDTFDYKSMVFMKPDFKNAVIGGNILTISKDGNKVKVKNNKNMKFELIMNATMKSGCCYLNNGGKWSGAINFTLDPSGQKTFEFVTIGSGDISVSATINLPAQIIEELKKKDDQIENKLHYEKTIK